MGYTLENSSAGRVGARAVKTDAAKDYAL